MATTRQVLSGACATVVLGVPLALAAIIWGGKLLVALLHALPQN